MTRDESLRAECVRHGVEDLFDEIVSKGETAQFAAMCAMRQPPGSRYTERAFMQDMNQSMDGMSDYVRKHVYEQAAKAGISTQGKVHKASIGPPSDPGAWVGSMDDVLAVAKARNLSVSGAVKHDAVATPPAKKKPKLAPDLVKRYRKAYLDQDPALAERVRKNKSASRELNERIVATHTRKK
jgi:hypothetical protein